MLAAQYGAARSTASPSDALSSCSSLCLLASSLASAPFSAFSAGSLVSPPTIFRPRARLPARPAASDSRSSSGRPPVPLTFPAGRARRPAKLQTYLVPAGRASAGRK